MPTFSPTHTEFLRESNAIEGVFDDDSLVQAMKAWEYLLKQKELTIPVILKTHKILMKNQALKKSEIGHFRTVPVWVGKCEGMGWREIPNSISDWCEDANTSIKVSGKDGKHIQLDHITYEKIHPFVDGNGRTGRMFFQWQRLKAGLPILIIWNHEKQEYYDWFNNS